MTRFKTKPLLSMLLALVMVVTMLPMTALAAEVPEETPTVCTDESCAHEHTEEPPIAESEEAPAAAVTEKPPAAETPTPSEAETAETPAASPVEVVADGNEEIPEAPEVDALPAVEMPPESTAYSGYIGDSAVEWELDPASGRLSITGSGGCDTFTSPEDQPWAAFREEIREVWFDGMATLIIENLAYWFDGCTSLTSAELPYTTLIIGESAFAGCPALATIMFYYSDSDEIEIVPGAFAVSEQTETTLLTIVNMQAATLRVALYDWEADNRHVHIQDIYCIMLLADCALGTCTCTSCSWYYDYDSAGSSGHDRWVHCTGCSAAFWLSTDSHSYSNNGYCSLCGYYNSAYDNSSVCYHTSTYITWSGCNWTEYCRNCGAYISSGTSHSYSYGAWEYYNGSQHRRLYSCSSCGQGSYEYGYHATSTNYSPYSATQHSVSSYCATCASTISTSYASHDFSYGSWQSYSGTQHRRLKTCSQCGYNEYEYASHSLTYGAWASISDTQHQRTGTCSCGYSTTKTGTHADANDNGYCDACAYIMTRFSVTVPASLSLTVSEHGAVYAADNAAIVNNSTGAIAVTGVTVSTANGWTLVPFSSNMAAAKVDAKHIGFSLNSAQSAITGTSENLPLPGAWSIAKGASLPLSYDAVVSAMSQPVSEQVLTIVFVLDWAA